METAGKSSTWTWAARGTHAMTAAGVRPLHAMVSEPSLLFLAALAAMLFHSADVSFYELDRVAFILLTFVVVIFVLARGEPLQIAGPATWPMAGLLLLTSFSLLRQPYDPEAWSVFAAKWLVPFTLFQLAGWVFSDDRSPRKFEGFSIIVLSYLSLIAVFFLIDAKSLVFPHYILDENIGIHGDRARGPFLQAVANGVSLNLLALIALDSFRRRRLPGLAALALMVLVPLAVVATKTRAVWLSFAVSVVILMFSSSPRVRRICQVLAITAGVGLALSISLTKPNDALSDRLKERSPVDFRMAVYSAGWDMFLEKPLTGWGGEMQGELSRRISDFHQEAFYFHNTYLEVVVEYGLIGLALYIWMAFELFRLGSRRQPHIPSPEGIFLDEGFRSIWPVMMAVYLLNATFVVMNYQFVNGLLFAIAGMLAGQNRRGLLRFRDFSN